MNKDLTYPTENKELPGNGAVVKIIEDSIESIIKSFGKPDYFYTQYFVDSKIKVDYVVGGKGYTEQYIIAGVVEAALQDAGFNTEQRLGMGTE